MPSLVAVTALVAKFFTVALAILSFRPGQMANSERSAAPQKTWPDPTPAPRSEDGAIAIEGTLTLRGRK